MENETIGKTRQKVLTRPIIIWSSIIIIGFGVKLLHLLSSVFIVIGFAGLSSYILIELMIKKKKNSLTWTLLILGVLFLLVLLGGAFFNNGYPINFKGVIAYALIFPICLAYYGLKNKKTTANIGH